MRPIILSFFNSNCDGNKWISFQDLHSKFSINFDRTYEKGVVDIYNHGMWYINLVYFFSTKTMRITKIHFGHCVGRYDPPSTELPRDFCAGIGPVQLGVVLVIGNFHSKYLIGLFSNTLKMFQISNRPIADTNKIYSFDLGI